MNLLSRQFVLPILIGFSLTGVSATLLYFLYKKDDDIVATGKPETVTYHRSQSECLVPTHYIPAIIGRQGAMIKDIQLKTDTQIYFRKDNVDSPCRTCVMIGTAESVALAESMIQKVIANQPIIETYEMYVPQGVCGRMIGSGGESIILIQIITNAKVIVESKNLGKGEDRRIIIKGTADQIAAATSMIRARVRKYKNMWSELEGTDSPRLPRGKLVPTTNVSNTPDNTVKTIAEPTLETNDSIMKVYVSAMENPCQFWVQVLGPGITALNKLVSEMTAYYDYEDNRELHTLKNVTAGQMVAAKFSFDGNWYRAEVLSVSDYDYCEVYFVDYGDRDVVQTNVILGLRTDFLSLRLQAIECSLANVKSRDAEWSEESRNRFATLVSLAQWKVLVAKVRGYKERLMSYGKSRREGSPIPYVDLYDKNCNKDINIGRELIREGLAESDEGSWSAASSTLSLSKRSHDAPGASSTPPPTSTPPSAGRNLSAEVVVTGTPVQLNTVHEIDLTTPKKPPQPIEEIDLVTPVKESTGTFINNEKKAHAEDGSGDHLRNEHTDARKNFKISKDTTIAPGGYESDLSEDSDELEMG